jgi:hypothetical protein
MPATRWEFSHEAEKIITVRSREYTNDIVQTCDFIPNIRDTSLCEGTKRSELLTLSYNTMHEIKLKLIPQNEGTDVPLHATNKYGGIKVYFQT